MVDGERHFNYPKYYAVSRFGQTQFRLGLPVRASTSQAGWAIGGTPALLLASIRSVYNNDRLVYNN